MSDNSNRSKVDMNQAWGQMLEILDKELPTQKKRRVWAWILPLLALLIGASIYGLYDFYGSEELNIIENESTENVTNSYVSSSTVSTTNKEQKSDINDVVAIQEKPNTKNNPVTLSSRDKENIDFLGENGKEKVISTSNDSPTQHSKSTVIQNNNVVVVIDDTSSPSLLKDSKFIDVQETTEEPNLLTSSLYEVVEVADLSQVVAKPLFKKSFLPAMEYPMFNKYEAGNWLIEGITQVANNGTRLGAALYYQIPFNDKFKFLPGIGYAQLQRTNGFNLNDLVWITQDHEVDVLNEPPGNSGAIIEGQTYYEWERLRSINLIAGLQYKPHHRWSIEYQLSMGYNLALIGNQVKYEYVEDEAEIFGSTITKIQDNDRVIPRNKLNKIFIDNAIGLQYQLSPRWYVGARYNVLNTNFVVSEVATSNANTLSHLWGMYFRFRI